MTAGCLFSVSCGGAEPYPDILPIGEVRGPVPDAGNASRFRSRLNQETVTVRGVLHQILRWRTGEGKDVYGVLIQNPPGESDGDPASSDGLFVYAGGAPTLPLNPQGEYYARVGDLVTLRGKVNERYGQTELSDAKVLTVKTGGDVDDLIQPVWLELPERAGERRRVLERVEGMRAGIRKGGVAVTGTHPNERTRDMQLWVVPSDHPVAQREDPLARRLYRSAHPLSDIDPEVNMDGHGNFVVLGSLGLKERLEDRDAHLPPLYAGSVIEGDLIGAIQYSWGEYILQITHLPEITAAEKPVQTLPEPDPDQPGLRIAAYNVENLYDYVNDPFRDCDFLGDSGCPGVREPFDYVPASDEMYRARLRNMARQIVTELDSPDLLMIQEVENQDIGKRVDGLMVYGAEDDADGQVDALQELALEIVAGGGPMYEVAVDRDGGDIRGITCAWMYLPERVRPLDPEDHAYLLGSDPVLPEHREWMPLVNEVSNPKAFNAVFSGTLDNEPELETVYSRAMQVFVVEDLHSGKTVWMFNNHFSAGPGHRVDRRRQQAAVNAELVNLILRQDPEAVVVVGGDLNVFPRPDDPTDPPSDQLGPLYEAGLYNVVERVLQESPATAYSYNYRGVVNVLDHFFLSPAAKEALRDVRYLKLNASAPRAFPGEPPQRASDHDPLWMELAFDSE
ncbi:MAG: endonuclease/exonuclease/phosphatase family protein [Kiritimatiellia bacterium]